MKDLQASVLQQAERFLLDNGGKRRSSRRSFSLHFDDNPYLSELTYRIRMPNGWSIQVGLYVSTSRIEYQVDILTPELVRNEPVGRKEALQSIGEFKEEVKRAKVFASLL